MIKYHAFVPNSKSLFLNTSSDKNVTKESMPYKYNEKLKSQLKGLSFFSFIDSLLSSKYMVAKDFYVHNKWLLWTKIIPKDKNITSSIKNVICTIHSISS